MRRRKWYRLATTPLLDFLYPPKCVFCNRNFDNTTHKICETCSLPTPRIEKTYLSIEDAKVPLFSCFTYQHAIRRLISQYKYAGQWSLKAPLKSLYIQSIQQLIASKQLDTSRVDIIIYAPSRREVLRQRGFHHLTLVSRDISKILMVDCAPHALTFRGKGSRQAALDEGSRKINASAITLNKRTPIAGKGILLIDDVITSGATMMNCCKALLGGGAHTVQAFALARAHKRLCV